MRRFVLAGFALALTLPVGVALGTAGATGPQDRYDAVQRRAEQACRDPRVVAEFAGGVSALCPQIMFYEISEASR